ncbi:PKD domain-containing protein [Microbacterium sp. NPDC056234]|uniref:PKD domain-containing protein n=1 Tax=Microbacterium sp. NPDC056234 TaxID=3345757 RepID=UPI0035DF25CB
MTNSSSIRSIRWRGSVALLLAGVLGIAGVLVAPVGAATAAVPTTKAPFLQRTDDVVTADPLPTVQIDSGYVWAQTTIGNTVYAAGSFSNARAALAEPGTNLTPRTNILAFDITTGNLLPFAPQVNGVIKAVAASPDGSRIYIGGSFNQVNGQTRWGIAALDAQTGALVPGFTPSIGGSGVYGLAVTADTIYVAGSFTQANGTARANLAAFATANGALRPWAPTTDQQADAIVVDPGGQHIIAAGRFYLVNGVVQRGMAALDPSSGAIDTGWAASDTVVNGWNTGASAGKAGIFTLATDASGVYGTGWVFADATVGNLEGTFAAEAGTGDIRWVTDCHGDHYGVYSTGETVYSTSHTHACETVNLWPEQSPRAYRYIEAFTATAEGTLTRSQTAGGLYADWSGTPSPSAYAWYPDFTVGTASGLGQAGLSITGTGDFIAVAGEFGSVNNQRYQGIVRFSTNPPSGAKQGPRLNSTTWAAPTASIAAPGRIRVSIPTNWDRDDRDLTYQLLRSGTQQPVDQITLPSGWWTRSTAVLSDSGLQAGATHTYTVRAVDADGNAVVSRAVTATVGNGTSSPYADLVLDDRAQVYYPLGTITSNWGAGGAPVIGGSVSSTTPGAVAGSTGLSASAFAGGSGGRVSSSPSSAPIDDFAVETWFKTSTNRGGKIFGWGNQQTGSSGSYDRHVYMQNNGRLTFGVHPGSVKTISSTAAYNDAKWHHVVATLGDGGMALYVDGQAVASDPAVTTAETYNGYWRVGGDNLGGWPNQPTNTYFVGSIDEFAVYPAALTAGQIMDHYAAGKNLQAPTAAFTSTAQHLAVAFDASASSAAAGESIVAYAWNWGDGTSASGISPTHTYDEPGTYDVTLTVTDGQGLSGATTEQVTVLAANQAPTAALVATTDGLTASVSGLGSQDPDGTIDSYSWDWGDGTPAGAGATSAHAYAAAGTYTITLTVTDDRGATATSSQPVTVTHESPTPAFEASASVLDVTVDAGASAASDGATMSYAWDWGDGTPDGSGLTAGHAYAQAGEYTITLTVTDSFGAHATKTRTVAVADVDFAVRDDFERSVTSGWGAAETGGTYTATSGSAAAGSVSTGTGLLTLAPGHTRNMALPSTTLLDSVASVKYSIDQAPSTGGSYVGLAARQSASGEYLTRVWLRSDGGMWLVVQRGSTVVASKALTSKWVATDVFNLEVEVTGASPTTIRAKTWKDGTAEPSAWQISTTDSTAAQQVAGWTGVHAARGGSTTSTAAFRFDALRVSDLSAPQNAAPVAAFASAAVDLAVTVDAAGSTDEDGTIASYAWDWGDGTAAGSGAEASHTYAAAGAYTVTLTVTDDKGATATTTGEVTVTAPVDPPDPAATASDDFERTVTGGWGNADVGGTWSVLYGSAAAASVSDGAGRLALAAGSTRNLMLNSAAIRDVELSVDFSLDAAPAAGSTYVGVVARSGATESYIVRSWLHANGSVWIVIQRGNTVLKSYPVPGITRAGGDAFSLKVRVAGADATTIEAKLWRAGTPEPATWQTTASDPAGLAAGAVGVHANRSSAATSTALVTVDRFRVADLE